MQDPTKLAFAPARGSADDVAWLTAKGIQTSPGLPADDERTGVVVGRRNATGWFISAYHRVGLNDEQNRRLRESVTSAAFTLLWHGPVAPPWVPETSTADQWRADIVDSALPRAGRRLATAGQGGRVTPGTG